MIRNTDSKTAQSIKMYFTFRNNNVMRLARCVFFHVFSTVKSSYPPQTLTRKQNGSMGAGRE